MKSILFILICITIPFYWSCDKIIPDLPRNNPLDTVNNKSSFLAYSSCKVVDKDNYYYTIMNVYETSNDSIYEILPNDSIYLYVVIKNNCNHTINNIVGTFSCSSNLIQILPPPSGGYVTLYDGYDEGISAGTTGWGETTGGGGDYVSPNNESDYAVHFIVSRSAKYGDNFTINMHLTDNANNNWNKNITLTVQ
jgi:hypothetical protein